MKNKQDKSSKKRTTDTRLLGASKNTVSPDHLNIIRSSYPLVTPIFSTGCANHFKIGVIYLSKFVHIRF